MTKISFEISGKTLRIGCDVARPIEISFRWPIAEVIQFGTNLVVRVEPDSGACDNQNVFAVDSMGNQIWTVTKRKYVYDDSPFTKITNDGGNLKLWNWDGLNVVVNPISWKELSVEYGR
jgi:hypothetical protein